MSILTREPVNSTWSLEVCLKIQMHNDKTHHVWGRRASEPVCTSCLACRKEDLLQEWFWSPQSLHCCPSEQSRSPGSDRWVCCCSQTATSQHTHLNALEQPATWVIHNGHILMTSCFYKHQWPTALIFGTHYTKLICNTMHQHIVCVRWWSCLILVHLNSEYTA